MTGPISVRTDIEIARRCQVPVLITAPPGAALAVASEIAAGGKRRRQKSAVVMCDGPAIVSAALRNRRATGLSGEAAVLIVGEVQALSATEQAALMLLLLDGAEGGARRIIATTSVCLWDRVERGAFSANLFYRLNAIHIMSRSCSDRPRADSQCCAEEADDSSSASRQTYFPRVC